MINKIKFLPLMFACFSLFSCVREKTEVTKFWNGGAASKELDNGVEQLTWFSTENQEPNLENNESLEFFVAQNSGDFLTHFSLTKSYIKVYQDYGQGWVFLKEDYFDAKNLFEIPKNKNEKLKNLAGEEITEDDFENNFIVFFGRDFSTFINYFFTDDEDKETRKDIFKDGENKLQNNAFIIPNISNVKGLNWHTMHAIKVELHYMHVTQKEVVQSFVIYPNNLRNMQEKILNINRNFKQ